MNIDEILKIQEHENDDIEAINKWLPCRIFDAHMHCWSYDYQTPVINDEARIPGETFNIFPWDLHRKILAEILPKIEYSAAVFGLPFKAAGLTNDYVYKLSASGDGLFPVMLLVDASDINAISNELANRFSGIKPYPTRQQKKRKGIRIIDVISDDILKIANAYSSAIVLHLPKNIFENLDELLHLASKYSDARFIIAHMGNNYRYHKDIKYVFREASRRPNVSFDTSMITDSAVIIEALTTLRKHQIIYGSDAPFSYIRGRYAVSEKEEVRLQSQTHFSWVNKEEYEKYKLEAKNFKLIHIGIILAIMDALKFLGLNKNDNIKNDIFYQNGKNIFTRRK